jgi:serine/threonine-protein kinase
MTQDPLVGKVIADRFAILERVGEGGMGVVYKAKQVSVDRIVAIKVLGAHISTDPSWVKRFHNEARAASRLDHPNTVRLIDFGQTKEGLLFIAMEFLHGTSLRTVIEKEGKISAQRTLKIISQMCGSLGEAHNAGIIHRDIKPDNVHLSEMRGAGDFVKVLDFSVAKLDSPDAQVTRAGVVFGTPAYMSPEQGRGVPLDRRSDIYAVGIVAYEMLNGKPPFDGRIPTEVVMMHLRDKPAPLPSSVPPSVAALVMKSLEKEPSKRQQTTEELDQECQAALAELQGGRMTPPTGAPAYGAPPMAASGPPPGGGQEMKTMMAQPAPVINRPPPGGNEMKTMMAQPAPNFSAPPMAAGGAPPMAPPMGGGGAAPPAAGQEMKTMMAQPAPVVNRGPSLNEMKTMMAQPAPVLPTSNPAARPDQRTMAVGAPAPSPQAVAGGTQVLPDSQGVVAFAQDRAQQARAAAPAAAPSGGGAGVLFWLAWVIIGVGVGLGYHFWAAHQAVQ